VLFLFGLSVTGFGQAPSCTVSPNPPSGTAALAVTINVTCPPSLNAGDSPFLAASIDFGDGNSGPRQSSSSFSVQHTYDRSGNFTITVDAQYSGASDVLGSANETVSPMPPGPAPAQGDIYIAGTAGTIERRKPDGTLVQVLYIGQNDVIGGMALDKTRKLFVSDSSAPLA